MTDQEVYERLAQLGEMPVSSDTDTEFYALIERYPEIWSEIKESAFCYENDC